MSVYVTSPVRRDLITTTIAAAATEVFDEVPKDRFTGCEYFVTILDNAGLISYFKMLFAHDTGGSYRQIWAHSQRRFSVVFTCVDTGSAFEIRITNNEAAAVEVNSYACKVRKRNC